MFNILTMWMLNSKKADSPSWTQTVFFSINLSVPSLPHFLRLVASCFFSLALSSLPIFIFVFVSPSCLVFLTLFLRTLGIYKSLTHPSPSFPLVLALFLSVSLHCSLCLLTVWWLVCNLKTPAPTVLRLSQCLHLFSWVTLMDSSWQRAESLVLSLSLFLSVPETHLSLCRHRVCWWTSRAQWQRAGMCYRQRDSDCGVLLSSGFQWLRKVRTGVTSTSTLPGGDCCFEAEL